MKRYKLYNNLVGWAVFFVALLSYCLTVEPSASFWDCPEFITAAACLEIGHPPGAPFFMLTANVFSHLTTDPAKISMMVNMMSGVLSAFTILFLFWTITHLIRRIIVRDEVCIRGGEGPTVAQTIVILASGVGGALAYAWSDTFWYSAVEAEVYAYSSMFTALVVLLMLKWEEHSHERRSDRWIVLIFYLMGLSIGVHLLNLLCLPALVLIYTFIRYPKTGYKGAFVALGISFVLVVAVLYGLVPGIVKVGGWFELFFVNHCGMPFNSGMIIYFAVLVPTVLAAVYSTTRRNIRPVINVLYTASVGLLGIPFLGNGPVMPFVIGGVLLTILFVLLFVRYKGHYLLRKQTLNTSMLCMLMMMVGYSTYTLTIIRSTQNPPMDQNAPEDIFTLGSYLNREQYGKDPLIYGRAYTSKGHEFNKVQRIRHHYNTAADSAAGKPDHYDTFTVNDGLNYPSAMKMLFPRMHSTATPHVQGYEGWLGGVTKRPVTYTYERNGEVRTGHGEMPTQLDNITYFVSYQIYQQFLRYFLWNFAGRQNDVSGHGEPYNGGFITGFDCIDNLIYGDYSKLPDHVRNNKGHNAFYCIPLLLGIVGLVWQLKRRKRGHQHFWVVFFLFFMTGLAIVLYINQPPSQPRERDYVYVGSFYAFSIWIGYGIAAIASWPRIIAARLKRRWNPRYDIRVALAAAGVALAVPLQMVSQTWDDHDRSGRTLARDTGYDFMVGLPEGEPILFTTGDNCTFPLWYIQDAEGVRRDARVINLSYLQTDWYIDQLREPAWSSSPLPIDWRHEEYMDDMDHEFFGVRKDYKELDSLKRELAANPELRKQYGGAADPYELRFVIDHYLRNPKYGYFPTDSLVVSVDKEAVLASGITLPAGFDSIPSKMHISLKGKTRVTKGNVMILEILARNNWKRPLYFSARCGNSEMGGLDQYVVREGMVSRVTPFKVGHGAIDSERMFDNMVHKFRYGGVSLPGVYLDEPNLDAAYSLRRAFLLLVAKLLDEGKTDKAREALECCKRVLPSSNVPYDGNSFGYDNQKGSLMMAEYWMRVGCNDEAERYLLEMADSKLKFFDYYNTVPAWRLAMVAGGRVHDWRVLDAAYRGLVACGSPHAAEVKDCMDKIPDTPVGRLISNLIAPPSDAATPSSDSVKSPSGSAQSPSGSASKSSGSTSKPSSSSTSSSKK